MYLWMAINSWYTCTLKHIQDNLQYVAHVFMTRLWDVVVTHFYCQQKSLLFA